MSENTEYSNLIKELERNGWRYDAAKKKGNIVYLFFFKEVNDEGPAKLKLPAINYPHMITEAMDDMTMYGYSLRITVARR